MDLDARPCRGARIVYHEAGGTQVLLNPDNGEYYALDDAGARIWELADGERTVSDIVAVLVSEYDAPADTIEADAMTLLRELATENLIDHA